MSVAFPDTLFKKNKHHTISEWIMRYINYCIVEIVCEQTIRLFEEFVNYMWF